MVIRSRIRSLWRSAGVSEKRLLVIFSSAGQFDTQYSFEYQIASGPSMRLLDLPPLRSELGASGFALPSPVADKCYSEQCHISCPPPGG